jgi:hypothetical protein
MMFKINADTGHPMVTPDPIASPNACWPASFKGKAQITYDPTGIVCKIGARYPLNGKKPHQHNRTHSSPAKPLRHVLRLDRRR